MNIYILSKKLRIDSKLLNLELNIKKELVETKAK